MKINVSKADYEGKWIDYEAPDGDVCKLKIRPYPNSRTNFSFRTDGEVSFKGADQYDVFDYCLMEWEDLIDENENKIPVSAVVKKMIFDYDLGGISSYVIGVSRKTEEEKQEDEDNL